jgi:hypothetical protein
MIKFNSVRFSAKNREVVERSCDLLWKMATSAELTFSQTVSEKAVAKFSDLLMSLEYDPHRKEILIQCIDKLKKVLFPFYIV